MPGLYNPVTMKPGPGMMPGPGEPEEDPRPTTPEYVPPGQPTEDPISTPPGPPEPPIPPEPQEPQPQASSD